MKRFPVNRPCPMSGAPHSRVLTHVPAAVVAAENPTYRPEYAEILGISPQDEFPFVMSPAGFVFAGWLPPEVFLRKLYEEVIDHSKTMTETVEYRRAQLEFGAAFLQAVERQGTAFSRPLRLLDDGCGYGALLRMLAGREIQSFGYDPSAERGARAAQGGLEIVNSLDAIVNAGPFDLLVLTEVLEHVPDPRLLLRFLRKNATPRALLAITVPQCDPAFVANCFDDLLKHGRLPLVFNPWEHLNYFAAGSLRRLLAEEGFSVVNDFGRAQPVYDAIARTGDAVGRNPILNALRIIKRAAVSSPSTQLFCQSTAVRA